MFCFKFSKLLLALIMSMSFLTTYAIQDENSRPRRTEVAFQEVDETAQVQQDEAGERTGVEVERRKHGIVRRGVTSGVRGTGRGVGTAGKATGKATAFAGKGTAKGAKVAAVSTADASVTAADATADASTVASKSTAKGATATAKTTAKGAKTVGKGTANVGKKVIGAFK